MLPVGTHATASRLVMPGRSDRLVNVDSVNVDFLPGSGGEKNHTESQPLSDMHERKAPGRYVPGPWAVVDEPYYLEAIVMPLSTTARVLA